MSHRREGVGIVGPEDLGHLLRQLQPPFHLFSHSVEYHNLTAVQKNQRTSLSIKPRMLLLLKRELRQVHTQYLVSSEIFLKLY